VVSVFITADMNNKHFQNVITPLIPNASLSYWDNLYCYLEIFRSYILFIIFIKWFSIIFLFLQVNIYIYIYIYCVLGKFCTTE